MGDYLNNMSLELRDYGFWILRNSVHRSRDRFYIREHHNESLQYIGFGTGPMDRNIILAGVLSIYDDSISRWLEDGIGPNRPYEVVNFAGKRIGQSNRATIKEVFRKDKNTRNAPFFDKTGWHISYNPTIDEQLEIVRRTVVPRMNSVMNQKDIITLYDEFGDVLNLRGPQTRRNYIAPYLMLKNYGLASNIIESILEYNRIVLMKKKDELDSDAYIQYEHFMNKALSHLYTIETLLQEQNEMKIKAYMDEMKNKNTALIKHAMVKH